MESIDLILCNELSINVYNALEVMNSFIDNVHSCCRWVEKGGAALEVRGEKGQHSIWPP